MCGRFAKYSSKEALIALIKGALPDVDESSFPLTCKESYNVAPTQLVLSVGRSVPDHPHKFGMLAWGFMPAWAKDTNRAAPINARGETVATSGMFREAFKKRRCLILSDGFYEWQKAVGGKIPYHFSMKDGKPFALAGIYEVCKLDGTPIPTCAVITTSPNSVCSPVHDRMPVIVRPEDYRRWCDPSIAGDGVADLIKPYRDEDMQVRRISTLVNAVRNNSPAILDPVI